MSEESTHAPTPFTADEIRTGCPPGREVTVRMPAGGVEVYWRTTFLESDASSVTITNQQVSADGEALDEPTRSESTWEDLRRHALFPASATSVTTVKVSTPMGELSCLRYDVSDGAEVHRLWFATSLPGLPVRTATLAKGVETVTSVVVADTSMTPR